MIDLREKYPWLVVGRGALGGVEVSGWETLVAEMFAELDRVFVDIDGVFHLQRIKEKWGCLTVYYSVDEKVKPLVEGIVRAAVQRSLVTCQECGAPGAERDGSWVKVLCDKHHAEREGE